MLFVLSMIIMTCERRPLEYDEILPTAKFDVKIDWSKSGIEPYAEDKGVHRVSFRFFPKDKQPIFERYLEGNVTEGQIEVTLGKYSVIVYNESIDDRNYWDEAITFTDVNSYDNFAANAVPYNAALRAQEFPFYKPLSGEQFIVDPLQLASWSIADFEVTENMVLVMKGARPSSSLTDEEAEMVNAFHNVVLRALTRPVKFTARIENMVSAQETYMVMRGFANKVYMASGKTTNNPVSYLFTLGGRKFDTGGKHGTMTANFRSFGRIPVSSSESYLTAADVLFGTGELYKPPKPLQFDVTNQVLQNYNTKVNIDLSIQYNLPFVEGGISVDDWEDDTYILE